MIQGSGFQCMCSTSSRWAWHRMSSGGPCAPRRRLDSMLPILTMSGARSTFVTSLPRCAEPLHTAETVPWSMACPQSIMPARICRGMHRHDNSWLGLAAPVLWCMACLQPTMPLRICRACTSMTSPCAWGLQVTEAEVAQHFADCGDIMDLPSVRRPQLRHALCLHRIQGGRSPCCRCHPPAQPVRGVTLFSSA